MDAAIIARIAEELSLSDSQVAATAGLFEKGTSAPFIAHYRREVTGGLDESKIHAIEDLLGWFRQIQDRRASLLALLAGEQRLTDDLRRRIENTWSKDEIEDLHNVFKPRRKTRAAEAREKGLEPLAQYIHEQDADAWSLEEHADVFINAEKQVASREQALQGAVDIIAEWISEDLTVRETLRETFWKEGALVSTVVPARASQKTKYSMYYDRKEPVASVPSHRVLAIRRGTKEGILTSAVEIDNSRILDTLSAHVIREQDSTFAPVLSIALRESYSRILRPAIEAEVRAALKDRAENDAIRVFQENLTNLLLSPPAGAMVVMGADLTRGDDCRLAVLGENGDFLEEAIVRLRPRKAPPAQSIPLQPAPHVGAEAMPAPPPAEASDISGQQAIEGFSGDVEAPGALQEPAEAPPERDQPAPAESLMAAVLDERAEALQFTAPTEGSGSGQVQAAHEVREEPPALPADAPSEEQAPEAHAAESASEPRPPETMEAEPAISLPVANEPQPYALEGAPSEEPVPEAHAAESASEPQPPKTMEAGLAISLPASDEPPAASASPEGEEAGSVQPGPVPAAVPESEATAVPDAGLPDAAGPGAAPDFEQAAEQVVPHATGTAQPPLDPVEAARPVIRGLVEKHAVHAIAIAGSAGTRALENLLRQVLAEEKLENVPIAAVNEAGLAIYASSRTAREEFPQLSISTRCAISLARRLQDPLAELVKIDPKLIGVGQYQHDVDQKKLHRALTNTVRSCASRVGADPNAAGAPLLRYIAGLNDRLARRIIATRSARGRFGARSDLLHVPGIDAAAYEQAAGFLRLRDAENPLDRTAVHPESYPLVEKMAASLGLSVGDLVGNRDSVAKLKLEDFVSENCGLPTLTDIREELIKPGRDPRRTFVIPTFRQDVREVADLREGMVIEGIVTNVTNFGAFVDVGVHQDGLVHLSQISSRFVRDPREAVKVGDVVQVKVLSIEAETKRIGLSIKALLPPPARRRRPQVPRRPPAQAAAQAPASREPSAEGAPPPSRTDHPRPGRDDSHHRRRPGRPDARREGRPPRRPDRPPDDRPRERLPAPAAEIPVAAREAKPAVPERSMSEKIELLRSKFRGNK